MLTLLFINVIDDYCKKFACFLFSFLHLLAWVDTAKIRVSSTRDEVDPVIMKVSLQNATFFHVFDPGRQVHVGCRKIILFVKIIVGGTCQATA